MNVKKPYSIYAHRKILYSVSIAFMLIGILGCFMRGGVALDIQFTGGALLKYTYQGEIDAEHGGWRRLRYPGPLDHRAAHHRLHDPRKPGGADLGGRIRHVLRRAG